MAFPRRYGWLTGGSASSRPSLRFGMFMGPFHATNLDPTYALERDLELVELSTGSASTKPGSASITRRRYELIAAPEVFIAAAAERTKHIRLGTGVKSLPYHHPFMLAEPMAQLDHMTRGRVMFGVGPGALPSDAKMIGIGRSHVQPAYGRGARRASSRCCAAKLSPKRPTGSNSTRRGSPSAAIPSRPWSLRSLPSARRQARSRRGGMARVCWCCRVSTMRRSNITCPTGRSTKNLRAPRPCRRSRALAIRRADTSCRKPRAGAQGC